MRKVYLSAVAGALILGGIGAGVAAASYARVHAPVGAVIDPSQMIMNAKDLPAADFVDLTLIFP